MRFNKATIVLPFLVTGANAGCPFLKGKTERNNTYLQQQQRIIYTKSHVTSRSLQQNGRTGDGGVPAVGYDAVKNDIIAILTVSQDVWPADFADTIGANYGPLMIRLAWHCAGSYRGTDGRGGCDGGRIRYEPELNWPDNANLDKALKLLEPIKEKYGSDLSWGDLVILAGNAAIESMGGPILGFCGGRVDDFDGSNSLILGPSDEQEELTPCVNDGNQGECTGNLGPTTVGLIYVNPAGHLGDPDPSGLIVDDIRSSFGKMGMNDTETLALIGGGHAFGKCHGACTNPPCGTEDDSMVGKGINTFSSGFEGAWTTVPTTWTNQYFSNLFDFDWNQITGPGGNPQWTPAAKNGVDPVPNIMMLTSDVALLKDPKFLAISEEFAANIETLEMQFEHAWYKVTTGDMGPRTRCLGDNIPPAQLFQAPLPESSSTLPNFIPIRKKIQDAIDGDMAKRGAFFSLAYKCASTFRETDYQGGCNGAYVRFDDDTETKATIGTLSAIKDDHSDVSFSDLIVLAAQVSLEDAGVDAIPFCAGRTDATDNRDHLKPIVYDSRLSASVKFKDTMNVQGLSARQGVALAGGKMPSGSDDMDNTFFVNLIEASDSGIQGDFTDEEWGLTEDGELKAIVKLYAVNKAEFMADFSSAWTYLMTADRFDGPRANACSNVSTPTLATTETSAASSRLSITCIVVGSIMTVAGLLLQMQN